MEDTTFYRARLVLERVEPYTDDRGHAHARVTEIAYIGLTGGTPAEAMEQIYDHAETLYGWHRTQADDRAAEDETASLPLLDEAVTPAVDKAVGDLFNSIINPNAWFMRGGLSSALDPAGRHRCAICAKPGPILHEGNRYVCPACTAVTDAVKRSDAEDEVKAALEAVRPFVACNAPDPNTPNWFCGRRLGHPEVFGCNYMPVDELPASADDEGDETAECGNRFDVLACRLTPGHEGPHVEGEEAWHNHRTPRRFYVTEPGQEGAEVENDPAFRDAEKPAPTAWCGNPDHDDPCDNCEAVLADASDALRQRMPTGEPKDAPIALGAPVIPARMWPTLLTGQ